MSNESKDSPISEDVENSVTDQIEEAIAGELIDDVEIEEKNESNSSTDTDSKNKKKKNYN